MNTPACRFHVPGPENTVTEPFAEFGPPLTLRRRIENYCWQLGLIKWDLCRPIQELGPRLVALGQTEEEAYAKACGLADETVKQLGAR